MLKKQPLLKAIEHNWGLMGPGDWSEVRWRVFYDGAYEVVSTFNPSSKDYDDAWKRNERPKSVKKKTTGKLADEVFSKLHEAIKCEPWRDPSLEVHACDGVAWEIKSYRDDGSIKKTSGKLDYIYGHRVLETIVSLLPSDGCKAKDPEQQKELVVCREFIAYREASQKRITSEEGKMLRMNRSIQAEGAFGQLKHNRRFVRFLTGGNVKVLSELYLLAISQNVLKVITKCNAGKLDFHLYIPETMA